MINPDMSSLVPVTGMQGLVGHSPVIGREKGSADGWDPRTICKIQGACTPCGFFANFLYARAGSLQKSTGYLHARAGSAWGSTGCLHAYAVFLQ